MPIVISSPRGGLGGRMEYLARQVSLHKARQVEAFLVDQLARTGMSIETFKDCYTLGDYPSQTEIDTERNVKVAYNYVTLIWNGDDRFVRPEDVESDSRPWAKIQLWTMPLTD